MAEKEILQDIISDFSPDKFTRFFREKNRTFSPRQGSFTHYNDECFTDGMKFGEIKFSESEKLIVCAFKASQPLSERSGKKAQYEKGKKILKDTQSDAGIVIFYDRHGNFRFSLIYPEVIGNRRQWSNFRRFTYFVRPDPEFTNKTFLQRIGGKDNDDGFTSLDKIKEAFSLSAVTDIFYKDFFVEYNKLTEVVKKRNKILDQEKARDFVLLFTVRTIFLGFIQKKGWLGNNEKFIQNFLKEYEAKYSGKDLFYKKWLAPLFFQALNSPPGRKAAYGDNDFSEETEKNMQMAPYLNGGLFKEKPDYDDQDYFLPDKEIKDFFDFLFSHNFTIEENSYEEEFLLELGKGFLFESRQKRFTFDEDHFFVDLVFYNRLLGCYVLIDLKIGEITHQDLGQVKEYKLYLPSKEELRRKLLEWSDDNASVGLLKKKTRDNV